MFVPASFDAAQINLPVVMAEWTRKIPAPGIPVASHCLKEKDDSDGYRLGVDSYLFDSNLARECAGSQPLI